MFGGGKCMFLPNTTKGGCRTDGEDLLAVAQSKHGWTVGDGSMADFKAKDTLPLMNLFTPDHMPYEIDRDQAVLPSLAEMTTRALDIRRPYLPPHHRRHAESKTVLLPEKIG